MSWRYLLRRLAQVPFAVLAVLAVTFLVVQAVPGDPAALMAGENASPEQIERLRRQYGLDRPLVLQFLAYLGRLLHGDLGYSYQHGRPVRDLILTFARPTLLLTGSALVVSSFVGVTLGVLAVRRPFGWRDKAINTTMLVVYAVPGFWIAQLAILYLVLGLGLFPLQGYSQVGRGAPGGLAHLADVARHLMLPVLVLAITETAAVTRVVRAGLLEESSHGYCRTALAKGLTEDEVMSRHTLRNAMRPMITLIGTRVGFLISGAAVIESIFVWPGLGTVLVGAADGRDRPLMLGLTLVVSLTIVAVNVVTDLVYRWVDPRISYD